MKIFTLLVVSFFVVLIMYVNLPDKETQNISNDIPPVTDTICTEDSFSVKDFVLELHLQGIKHPDVVLRQACWESGFFTSNIWKKKNNPFGFYADSTYILFNDWRSSVAYYKSWQDKRYKGGDYYEFLSKIGYAEDTNYLDCVKGVDLHNLEKK